MTLTKFIKKKSISTNSITSRLKYGFTELRSHLSFLFGVDEKLKID